MPGVSESHGASTIFIRGSFNPAILTPTWLLAKGLIDEIDHAEATGSDGKMVVTPVFSGGRFRWLLYEATREQLKLVSTAETETPERLREFVIGFFNALPETPVATLEVTHFWHARAEEGVWDRLADRFSPANAWADLAPRSELRTVERRIGYDEGHLEITLQPSRREGMAIYLGVERSWHLGESADAQTLVQVLDGNWDDIRRIADEICADILSKA